MRHTLKRDRAVPKRQPFNFIGKKRNGIIFSSSVCAVQCGRVEGKALSFVLHTAGSEHHQ